MTTTTITRKQALAIGGKLWTSPDGKVTRVYLPVADLISLDITRYGTGNIRGASLAGEAISNAEANRLLGTKAWADKDGIHVQTSARVITAEQIEAAVLAAVAALPEQA